MKCILCLCLITSLLATLGASAAPAQWYLWQSKLDGKLVCLQTPPGPGWTKINGPFNNSDCTRPVHPANGY
ncbi:hypothetical protein LG201_04565 [Methylobacillus gramineus]|uniref:hypothetical protein n=1 Tax=Methylobacillus gramineus TaxID=755169 RepID=UPI001CFF9CAE|nr:hypothetical protein [Methylobacillus gramineus]MCB5184470.1 hypothetical protein [Methylobacillus gramineus]